MVSLLGPDTPDGVHDPRLYDEIDDLFMSTGLAELIGSMVFATAVIRHQSLVCIGRAFGASHETTNAAIEEALASGIVAIDGQGTVSVGNNHESRLRLSRRSRFHPSPIWDGTWVSLSFPKGTDHPDAPTDVQDLIVGDHFRLLNATEWIRPDNLGTRDRLPQTASQSSAFAASTVDIEQPRHTASQLWSLEAFSERSAALIETVESFSAQTTHDADRHVAQGWVLLCAMGSQLERDPMLPPALLPRAWTGYKLPPLMRSLSLHMREGFTQQLQMEFPPGA